MNLIVPDREYALSVLTRSYDEIRATLLWQEACEACQVSSNTTDLDELHTIFNYFTTLPGKIAIHGLSFQIRMMTYRNLLAREMKNMG